MQIRMLVALSFLNCNFSSSSFFFVVAVPYIVCMLALTSVEILLKFVTC